MEGETVIFSVSFIDFLKGFFLLKAILFKETFRQIFRTF